MRSSPVQNMNAMIQQEEIIIQPPSKLAHLDLWALYRYRHLMWSMVRKRVRTDLDDMYLGFFWAIARPLAMLAIFVLVRNYSGADMHVTISYPLYLYSGLILWFHFRETVMAAARSFAKDADIMKKVYYPHLISPIVAVVARFNTLGFAMIPLILLMLWHRAYPDWRIALLPLVLLQCMILVLGIGIIVACLSLTKKDLEKLLDLCLYLGLFVSPVIFAPDMIPERGRVIYFLNPMAGTLLAFRSSLFHDFPFPLWQFAYSVAMSLLLFAMSMFVFRRVEIYMADRL